MGKIKNWLFGSAVLLSATLANAAGNFAATDTLTNQMGLLATDVSESITPKAITIVVAVALLVASRSLIKKFFKI